MLGFRDRLPWEKANKDTKGCCFTLSPKVLPSALKTSAVLATSFPSLSQSGFYVLKKLSSSPLSDKVSCHLRMWRVSWNQIEWNWSVADCMNRFYVRIEKTQSRIDCFRHSIHRMKNFTFRLMHFHNRFWHVSADSYSRSCVDRLFGREIK